MLRLLYEAVNQGLLNETYLAKQRNYVKELLKLRRKYCTTLKIESIEYGNLLEILKEKETNYFNENKDTLVAAIRESSKIESLQIIEIIVDSLKLDLDNPKIELSQKLALIKNVHENVTNLGSTIKKFNPYQKIEYTSCPISFLAPYTRAGKGDTLVFAAPGKTGKTAVVLINVVNDCLNGKKVLYLDYANGWEEILLRVVSIIHKVNYGALPPEEINTVLNAFKNTDVFLNLMSNFKYEEYPDKVTTKRLIEECEYDYIVFDDLHRVIFDSNIAESTLKAYNWAVELNKQHKQCGLILGHPNDTNVTFDTFVLSGGVRVHKDITTIIAMLSTADKNTKEIKIVIERKRVSDWYAKLILNGIMSYEEKPIEARDEIFNTVLKPLNSSNDFNDFTGLGLL